MNNKEKTFILDDLDEQFWNKVAFAEFERSSGLGGPGCVWLVTTDRIIYFIGMEGFPCDENKIEEAFPIFERKEKVEDYNHPYKTEENGWKYVVDGNGALVRDDLYADFMKAYQAEKERQKTWKSEFIHMPDIAGVALGVEGKMERYDYENTVHLWKEQENESKKVEEERRQLKLKQTDITWKELHRNNDMDFPLDGFYTLLIKRNPDGAIIADKWTIKYQWNEEGCYHDSITGEIIGTIESYNLFYMHYDDVEGILSYPDLATNHAKDKEEYRTFSRYGVNTYGEFVRAYRTLEAAKEGAIEHNYREGSYIDKSNILYDYCSKEEQYKIRLKIYEPMVIFANHCEEIVKIVEKYEKPDNVGWGYYVINEIAERLKIDRGYALRILNYNLRTLEKEKIEEAKKIVNECKAYVMDEMG